MGKSASPINRITAFPSVRTLWSEEGSLDQTKTQDGRRTCKALKSRMATKSLVDEMTMRSMKMKKTDLVVEDVALHPICNSDA